MDNDSKKMDENQVCAAEKAKTNRVKRMRGWLGINRASGKSHFDDAGGPVSYGDSPNGWNR